MLVVAFRDELVGARSGTGMHAPPHPGTLGQALMSGSRGAAEEPEPPPPSSSAPPTASYDPRQGQSKTTKGKTADKGKGKGKGEDTPPPALCGWCEKLGATLRCSQCKSEVYCNKECQRVGVRREGTQNWQLLSKKGLPSSTLVFQKKRQEISRA